MKKTIFGIILFVGSLNIKGQEKIIAPQVKAGSVSLGGVFGYSSSSVTNTSTFDNSSTSSEGSSSSTFSLLPSLQIFVANKFSIGLQTGYIRSSAIDKSSTYTVGNYTASGFSISPLCRYYAMLNENTGFYFQVAVPLYFGSVETKIYNTYNYYPTPALQDNFNFVTYNPYLSSSVSSYGFQFSPGFIFFPHRRIGIGASIGNILGVSVIHTKEDNDNSSTTQNSNTVTSWDIFKLSNMSLNIGFQLYIGKK